MKEDLHSGSIITVVELSRLFILAVKLVRRCFGMNYSTNSWLIFLCNILDRLSNDQNYDHTTLTVWN